MHSETGNPVFGWSLALLALLAAPAWAQTVLKGSDVWNTPGDGSTNAVLNLPLDFFDPGCSFQGTVVLRGKNVATSPANAFGNADSVIERLQDAVFDVNGVAVVSIAAKALSLESTQPLSTPCGQWAAAVSLNNPQAITRMTIKRAGSTGGTFTAPISVATTWTFTRSDGAVRTLDTNNVLDSSLPTEWRYSSCPGAVKTGGVVQVDTDNDGVPDTAVNGVSNFFAGYTANCQLLKPCRNKNVDPATHCYEPASSLIVPDPKPVEPK
jgi:hypothetical protein